MSSNGDYIGGVSGGELNDRPDNSISLEFEDDDDIRLTPETAELIRYIPEYAPYNHIQFVADGEVQYIFQTAVPEVYEEIVDLMVEQDYPERRNVRAIGSAVLEAFDGAMCQDLEQLSTLPEEWLTN